MKNYPDGVTHAQQAGITVETFSKMLNREEEQKAMVRVMDKFRPDWLIVDLPYQDVDTSYFSSLRSKGTGICFIDDARFITPDADVIMNSSILAPYKIKKNGKNSTKYFLGPEFLVFRDSVSCVDPKRKAGMTNILITFGGSDPTNLTNKVMSALSDFRYKGIHFTVILGPGFGSTADINSIVASGAFESIDVVVNPPNIIEYFEGSDLVACAGGRTMYELFHLNIPFIPIATTPSEAEAIAEFRQQGIAPFGMAEWDTTRFTDNLGKMIADLYCYKKEFINYHGRC